MIRFNCYFREKVIRKFIEASDWHPIYGKDYYRPLNLSVRQFYQKCDVEGYDWYKWKEIREQLPLLNEMIEVLEEWSYRFRNRNGLFDFVERPEFENIKVSYPITRISKNLKRSSMNEYPVLNGMLYDQEIKKRNALQAINLISQGWKVKDAISESKTSYPSIKEFGYKGTGRQCPRKTIKKVGEVIERISAGEKLKPLLKRSGLGAWSYYRYRGYF